jgi:hypothetical protein
VAIDWAGTDPCCARRRHSSTRAAGRYGFFRTSTPPPFRPAVAPGTGGNTTGRARRDATRRTPRRNDAGRKVPPRDRNAATAYTSSAGTDIATYDDLPGYHLLAARRLIATDDESYHCFNSELSPTTSHGYAEWDFSDVPHPVMFRRFLDAADYWFGYSDTSSIEDYDPARERFMVGVGDAVDGVNAMGAGDGEDPRTRG